MSASELLDWAALPSGSVHPTRLWILEAMRWIDRPLSASELVKVFGEEQSIATIAYHARVLAQLGLMAQVDERKVRGASKQLYVFASAVES